MVAVGLLRSGLTPGFRSLSLFFIFFSGYCMMDACVSVGVSGALW